jgi:hypothetical protein
VLRKIAILVAVLLLQACGTKPFTPAMYPLRAGLIGPIQAAGQPNVTNDQPDKSTVVVYSYGGTSLESSLNAITTAMVQQTNEEIRKNAKIAGGAAKTVALKVSHLRSEYSFFHWKSKLRFEARLGDGAIVAKEVPHASGDPYQDLNGCIAEAVMTLLNDGAVRAYLEKK